jgi:hypothetical protein
MPLFDTVTDLSQDAETLRRRRYGVIEVIDGRFHRVILRPWPTILIGPEVVWFGKWQHAWQQGDRVRLYYNQPWRFPNFLALAYSVSSRQTSMRSIRVCLEAFDEIARLKRSDALLADLSNWRISGRFMQRWGWEPHCPTTWWHRHFIKRFYGKYPLRPAWLGPSKEPGGACPDDQCEVVERRGAIQFERAIGHGCAREAVSAGEDQLAASPGYGGPVEY